jgi:ankyrin repeat protein
MRFLLPLLAVVGGFVFLASQGADRQRDAALGERLCAAVSSSNLAEATRLLEDGAPIDYESKNTGVPVLMEAVVGGDERRVQWALQHGANVNWRNGAGFTPLMYAASRGDNIAIAQDLVRAGAAVNNSSELGVTALIIAAQRGDASLTRLLVDAGASVSVTGCDGRMIPINSDDAECRRILASRRIVAVRHPAPGECEPTSYR